MSKAIELDPESACSYNSRGIEYSNKGEFDNANQDIKYAIKLEPNNNYFHYWLKQVIDDKNQLGICQP